MEPIEKIFGMVCMLRCIRILEKISVMEKPKDDTVIHDYKTIKIALLRQIALNIKDLNYKLEKEKYERS